MGICSFCLSTWRASIFSQLGLNEMTRNETLLVAAIRRLLAIPTPPEDFGSNSRYRYAIRVRESAEKLIGEIETQTERKP